MVESRKNTRLIYCLQMNEKSKILFRYATKLVLLKLKKKG